MEPLGNDRWRGAFEPTALGRWQYSIVAWVDRLASWRHEIERKVEAGQTDLAERARGGCRAARRQERSPLEEGLDPSRDQDPPARRDAAPALELIVDRERASFGAWYELFPRSWGGFAGVERVLPELAAARLRRPLPPADPSDRPHAPQGQEQRARRRARTIRAARGRSAPRKAATRRSRPSSARSPTSSASSRAAPSTASRSRSTSRSSARPTTPGSTSTPSGSSAAPTARSSTPRTRPSATRTSTTSTSQSEDWRGALEGAPRRRPHLGRARRPDLPRRQPAHEAGRVLGVADPRGAGRPPRRRLPVRGVHAPGDDGDAREGRLQPVLHLLHLAEHEGGADRVRAAAHESATCRSSSGRTSSPTRRTSSRVPAARRPARVRGPARARRDALAELRHLLGLRELRERPARGRAARSTWTRRSTSSRQRALDGAAAAARRPAERRSAARTRRCSGSTTSRSSRPRTSS